MKKGTKLIYKKYLDDMSKSYLAKLRKLAGKINPNSRIKSAAFPILRESLNLRPKGIC